MTLFLIVTCVVLVLVCFKLKSYANKLRQQVKEMKDGE